MVNGKDIMNVLQLKSGGPLVKDWVMNSSSIPNRNDSQLQLLTFVSLDSNKNLFNGSLHIPLGQLKIALIG